MTSECYLHVIHPSQSKSICTKKNLWRSYIVIGLAGLLIPIIYPLNRVAKLQKQCGKHHLVIESSLGEPMKVLTDSYQNQLKEYVVMSHRNKAY